MKTILETLSDRLKAAMTTVTGQEDCDPLVRQASDPRFGDYQANGIMGAAKRLKTAPRALAEQVVAAATLDDICEPPEVAGPGFINLRLKPTFLADRLAALAGDERLGVEPTDRPRRVVVDFSSPNIAKQMHVGHLRSTIIGDAICRILEFQGHTVIRQNHIGDWGTQFGMLCAMLERKAQQAGASADDVLPQSLENAEALYREAKALFDSDPAFEQAARQAVVGLHQGESRWLERWRALVGQSRQQYQRIYERLGVTLRAEHERGESAYHAVLPTVVADLRSAGLAVESEGAVCVFPEGFKNKQGQPLPFIVQKSDGAYLYATTDLAALRYRVDELRAERIIYVTDFRQSQHFAMLFATARAAGWAPEAVELEHVSFGTMLGEDGKPFKTRSGGTVKLAELLDEAVERAMAVVEQKNPELPTERKQQIAEAVGIGAVKYADYSTNRQSDYVFSFDRMLALEGNTAPYMQYAYARIKSIERKAAGRDVDIAAELDAIEQVALTEPAEIALARQLARYGEAVEAAAQDWRLNLLTQYLYDLAQAFSAFYTNCPVLQATDDRRPTRLLLCDLTARTIQHGLKELLGISVVDQM